MIGGGCSGMVDMRTRSTAKHLTQWAMPAALPQQADHGDRLFMLRSVLGKLACSATYKKKN